MIRKPRRIELIEGRTTIAIAKIESLERRINEIEKINNQLCEEIEMLKGAK